jgi:hypothetical protein
LYLVQYNYTLFFKERQVKITNKVRDYIYNHGYRA